MLPFPIYQALSATWKCSPDPDNTTPLYPHHPLPTLTIPSLSSPSPPYPQHHLPILTIPYLSSQPPPYPHHPLLILNIPSLSSPSPLYPHHRSFHSICSRDIYPSAKLHTSPFIVWGCYQEAAAPSRLHFQADELATEQATCPVLTYDNGSDMCVFAPRSSRSGWASSILSPFCLDIEDSRSPRL